MANRLLIKRFSRAILIFLLIEFIDELVFGARETAWPLVREDLNLTYTHIGIALSLPALFSTLVEPVIGIWADTGLRRAFILGGGIAFTLALVATGLSPTFAFLLLASFVLFPASGAFVSLSQASLMDLEPTRHEQNMARWTFAGSIGAFTGPLFLGAFTWLGWGWRGTMFALAIISAIVLLMAWIGLPRTIQTVSIAPGNEQFNNRLTFRQSFSRALSAFSRKEVIRWLILLEFSDLMLDVFFGFLALYLVDIAYFTPSQAALGVAVWTGVGLLGDFLLIPLLERVRGLVYLRVSVIIELVLFPAFLLLEPIPAKIGVLGLLGFFNSGWYSILKGRLYSEISDQTSTVLVLDNAAALIGKLFPLALGIAAERLGLDMAMWLLLAGPIALLIGLPRNSK